jgi:hypothetical protein
MGAPSGGSNAAQFTCMIQVSALKLLKIGARLETILSPLKTVEQVLALYQEKDYDLNVRHFREKLDESHSRLPQRFYRDHLR